MIPSATRPLQKPQGAGHPKPGLFDKARASRPEPVTNCDQFQKHRAPKFPPRAFTQEGVAMLSGVLRSPRPIEINLGIMRAFVRLREPLTTNTELARKVAPHDRQIAVLFEHVRDMLRPAPVRKNPIGFIPQKS